MGARLRRCAENKTVGGAARGWSIEAYSALAIRHLRRTTSSNYEFMTPLE